LGLRPRTLTGGLGDRHAFAGAGPDQVSFELGDHAEDAEEQPADGVGAVVDRSPEVQGNALLGEPVRDVGRVSQRAGETVELPDDKNIFGTGRRCGLPQAWPPSSRTRQAVINMDVILVNTERLKTITLCCEILP